MQLKLCFRVIKPKSCFTERSCGDYFQRRYSFAVLPPTDDCCPLIFRSSISSRLVSKLWSWRYGGCSKTTAYYVTNPFWTYVQMISIHSFLTMKEIYLESEYCIYMIRVGYTRVLESCIILSLLKKEKNEWSKRNKLIKCSIWSV